ncbi:DEAD/DEAH box helicase [Haematospirillum sp. 15-248]|uniref:DEAD/DEAH box helicase n=1 Tax=Haematospirillum sp. 15-248 TaxID=2723107 RepID=UPI00143A78E8|nr:DEAD/DEAH box helicase [Haematospirillum sp. 15-248]NKD87085.1 DEAD/DEAH box helicase [Haematospirillum sp. 15-248]
MTPFSDLGLDPRLLKALEEEGYSIPTPIQGKAIPPALEGRDVLGLAQTGTGKTAAFTLPILHRLACNPMRPAPRTARALILTPTRELAVQIGDSLAAYSRFMRLKRAVVFGGVGMGPQVRFMANGVDVLVATPGRLLDHVNQGTIRLNGTEIVVLDEADRMLDMGFIHDVKRLFRGLPPNRQTLLFSATMPRAVEELTTDYLRESVRVEVAPQSTTAERIEQRVLFVHRGDKRDLLTDLLNSNEVSRAIVFTRTKHGANRVVEHLSEQGIRADALHGDKSQGARQKALNGFRKGIVRALVATDIAARGIDVDGITHVINYELPNEPESYVHRIGRTARAGAGGIALSFCDNEEIAYLRSIEKAIRMQVPMELEHAFHNTDIASLYASGRYVAPPKRGGGGGRPGGGRHQGKPGGERTRPGRDRDDRSASFSGRTRNDGQHFSSRRNDPAQGEGGRRPPREGQQAQDGHRAGKPFRQGERRSFHADDRSGGERRGPDREFGQKRGFGGRSNMERRFQNRKPA